MKMLDHPNVVKLYETFEEENKLHLVLELCEGGDLFEFIMKTSILDGKKTWSDGSGVQFVWTEGRLADMARYRTRNAVCSICIGERRDSNGARRSRV